MRRNKHDNEGIPNNLRSSNTGTKSRVTLKLQCVLNGSQVSISIPGAARDLGESSSPQSLYYTMYIDASVKCEYYY